MKQVIIQWQDQFGNWQHYTTMHHQPSAYKTAQNRASKQNKRYRLVDDGGHLIDLINPGNHETFNLFLYFACCSLCKCPYIGRFLGAICRNCTELLKNKKQN